MGAATALLGVVLVGLLAGAMAGVVIVDNTDASASHPALDYAILALCVLAGILLALWVGGRTGGDARPPRGPRGPTEPSG